MTASRWFSTIVLALALAGLPHAQTQTPPPVEALGFEPGADYHLATYEQAIGYFERLAHESPRIRVLDMGVTGMGRPMKYAVVSSEANLEALDRYKEISRRLTLARGLDEDAARRLADQGRVIVWIDGGLHATECAPAQQMIQLAYDLVSGEDAETRRVRDEVIAILVFANPDGMTLVSDWYQPNVGTPFEASPLPWTYNQYAGHDNNRDALYANLVETRNMMRAQFHEWFPEVLVNHHQGAPQPSRIFVPPGPEPTNADVHPLVWREQNLIGSAMAMTFELAGRTGVISRLSYDSYYPGYCTTIADSHNCPAILTETASSQYANPLSSDPGDFPEAYRDLTPGRFYTSPWTGGPWRLGDAVGYVLTASKGVLQVAARYRRELLWNKYVMGRDALALGASEKPYGWIVPADQHDPWALGDLIERLMLLGVEVYRSDEAFDDGGVSYAAGTYLVPASQPFRAYVREVFQRQSYPDLRRYPHLWQNAGGRPVPVDEPLRPYDATGWTLPLQFGLEYAEMSRPIDARRTRLEGPPAAEGGLRGDGPQMVLGREDTRSYTAVTRLLAAGASVASATEPFAIGTEPYAAGTFVIETGRASRAAIARVAAETGVTLTAGRVEAKRRPVTAPRIGVYRSWMDSMDEGWIRLILDRLDMPYARLTNDDVRKGGLAATFDVIVLPSESPQAILDGRRAGSMPPPYAGGIGAEGLASLRAFVESGGVLVCNHQSSRLAIDAFDLPIADALDGVAPRDFWIPGSILRTAFDPSHPLAYGMPASGASFFSGGLAFLLPEASGDGVAPTVAARYPDRPLLLSGTADGDEHLRGRAAVVDVPVGRGRVVLFGFNVVNRAHTPGVWKLLLNALIGPA